MVSVQSNSSVELLAKLLQHTVQRLNLLGVARVTIENPAALSIIHLETILNNAIRHLIRNELTLVDVLASLLTQRGIVLEVVTENVARGDVWDAVVLRKASCLGTFTNALRAHNEKSHSISS